MEDRSRFSGISFDGLSCDDVNGKRMVDASRSILLVDYKDDEYSQEFFSTFNLIVDEAGDGGIDYGEIEALYKTSFINAISRFRDFYGV